MKYLITIYLIITLNACAFKESDKKAEEGVGVSLGVANRQFALISFKERDHEKTEKVSILGSGHNLRGDRALTIPALVPNEIRVSIPFQGTQSIHAKFQSEKLRFDLNSKINSDGSYSILGLSSVLSKSDSIRGTLVIEGLGEKPWGVSLDIRTPPSQVTKRELSPSEWLSRQGLDQESVRLLNVRNKTLNLVRVIEFKNESGDKLTLSLPRRNGLKISQNETEINYTQRNCGFDLNQVPNQKPLSRDVVILPIDFRLMPEALESMKDQDLDSAIETALDPAESISFGVYGLGSEVDSFASQGPKGSDLSRVSVVSGCHRGGCEEQECHGRDPSPIGVFSEHPMLCSCVSWSTIIDHANIDIGTARGAVTLNSNFETNAQVRFSDDEEGAEHREVTALPVSVRLSE